MNKLLPLTQIGLVAGALVLSACNPSGNATGELSLQLTDAAVRNATNVYLTISSVTVHGEDGTETLTLVDENDEATPIQIDLLGLSGTNALDLISGWTLPAGEYQWIRLNVETGTSFEPYDSYVVLDDSAEQPITISSGQLKLNRGFTIPANGTADFTLDVDLYKALVMDNNGYKLKPVMRLIDNVSAGHISGTVDGNLLTECGMVESAAVYAFAGADTEFSDVNGDEGPELVAWVDMIENEYLYTLGFLTTGDYSLYLVCDPEDNPDAQDDLTPAAGPLVVSVAADGMEQADFETQ